MVPTCLTDARREVATHTRSGVTLPSVDVIHRFDYDASGRLLSQRFEGINGATKILAYDYLQDGSQSWPRSSEQKSRFHK